MCTNTTRTKPQVRTYKQSLQLHEPLNSFPTLIYLSNTLCCPWLALNLICLYDIMWPRTGLRLEKHLGISPPSISQIPKAWRTRSVPSVESRRWDSALSNASVPAAFFSKTCQCVDKANGSRIMLKISKYLRGSFITGDMWEKCNIS